ncbi:MAG TPA: hypothetical protein VFW75_04350 [Acetobacteraceae bacterium]|nr:hypothetical protein [Acetobacteraceae bacterium]
MTPDYRTMLRSAVQVQAATNAAGLEFAIRSGRFLANGAMLLMRAAAGPLGAAPEHRQAAVEDAVWTAYAAHEELLRAATGMSRLAALIFLNELDLRRGDRPASDSVEPGGDSV